MATAGTDGEKDEGKTADQSAAVSDAHPDLFEENFKELKKWADIKSSKYGTLLVMRERRCGRFGTALKVCFAMKYLSLLYRLGVFLVSFILLPSRPINLVRTRYEVSSLGWD